MTLPSNDNMKAKLSKELENSHHPCQLESSKSSLKLTCELVRKANNKPHLKIRLYDRRVKLISFEVRYLVYLYNEARKPGQCHKFLKPWTGPFRMTAKLSDLNYEIVSLNRRKTNCAC